MAKFLSGLVIELVKENGARPTWVLHMPLRYSSDVAGEVITVPGGFTTDLASVPRVPVAWLLAGGKACAAAVVHDYLYVSCATDKVTADKVFREAMKVTGISLFRRTIMYLAVRLFGSPDC